MAMAAPTGCARVPGMISSPFTAPQRTFAPPVLRGETPTIAGAVPGGAPKRSLERLEAVVVWKRQRGDAPLPGDTKVQMAQVVKVPTIGVDNRKTLPLVPLFKPPSPTATTTTFEEEDRPRDDALVVVKQEGLGREGVTEERWEFLFAVGLLKALGQASR